jgi:phospholipid/cholesterol/gamma-HCH transport system substrate-binding protein
MYASRTTQFIVGIFALVGIAALAILSLKLGKVGLFPTPSYVVYADFDNVAGLKEADPLEIAGVKVGKVLAIQLGDHYRARVALQVRDGVKIDDEAIVSIKTSGIIGDKYVSISPGAGERILKAGDVIRQTESAFVLEDVFGQLINSSGSSGGATGGKNQKEKGTK